MKAPTILCFAIALLVFGAVTSARTARACDDGLPWLMRPIQAPSPNASALSGSVTLEAQASAELQPKIKFADFLLDAKPLAVVQTAPYRVTWDTTKVGDGVHYLQARAHLSDGVIIGTPLKKVTVGNAPVAAPAG